MAGVEDCLKEGAVGGVPRILKPQEEPLHPVIADLDSVTGLLQQFLHVQRDLNERWEKDTLRQDQRWHQLQIQINKNKKIWSSSTEKGSPSRSHHLWNNWRGKRSLSPCPEREVGGIGEKQMYQN
ncbi:hypothetical protein CRENBAI_012845 [Crenichthys baileyi]|uniref:Uncharacterized protein n=1 Tax=Crenichthys baileyi TaxID=28760 RepID=A0AAV9RTW4_9TELE